MILGKVGVMLQIEFNNLIGRLKFQKLYDLKIGNQAHIQSLQPYLKKANQEIKI